MAGDLETFADRIDRLNGAVGRAAAWLALAIVVLQFVLVVARYLFSLGSIWLTETVLYAHAALFLLAAAWTLEVGGHVRVDVFYAGARPRTRAWIDLAGALVLLLPFMLVLVWLSWPYAARSWAVLRRGSAGSVGAGRVQGHIELEADAGLRPRGRASRGPPQESPS